MNPSLPPASGLRVGMIGVGMIFEDTYRPFFEAVANEPLFVTAIGPVRVRLTAAASRTGARVARLIADPASQFGQVGNYFGHDAIEQLLRSGIDAVCVATPDDRHFASAYAALAAGKHVLIEKPCVLTARGARRVKCAGCPAWCACQGRLPQARRSRSQETAHARRRWRPQARQQRLLLAAGTEVDQRRAVRRVDSRPQSRHLRRRPLPQADRLHASARTGRSIASRPPASVDWSGPPTDRPGTRSSFRSSTATPMVARPRSTSTRVG